MAPKHEQQPFQKGDDDPAVQAYRLREVESDVKEMKSMVIDIHTWQKTFQQCPKPGLCIDLKETVTDLDRAYRSMKGAWITVGVVCSVASGVLTLLAAYIYQH